MDNLAHALIGAALGRAAGGERLPRPALIGAIAANAPDWTEVLTGWPWPGTVYLAEHRGITHSLLGCAVQVAVFTLLSGLALRRWRRDGAASWSWLLAFFAFVIATHPIMDWQGSYGWRPFLPWSDRWYYGDFVAIVDPVYWIVPLVALAWGAPRDWRPALGYFVILAPATVLVLSTTITAGWLKLLWIAVLAGGLAGWAAHWFGAARRRQAAAWGLSLVAAYTLAQGLVSLPVRATLRRAAHERFGRNAQWAALTVIGRPFTWEPIAAGPDTVAGGDWVLPRHLDDPAVRSALHETRDGRAIARFARFLAARVDSLPGHTTIRLFDARYSLGRGSGWAVVVLSGE